MDKIVFFPSIWFMLNWSEHFHYPLFRGSMITYMIVVANAQYALCNNYVLPRWGSNYVVRRKLISVSDRDSSCVSPKEMLLRKSFHAPIYHKTMFYTSLGN